MGRVMMVVRPSKGGAFGHVTKLADALTDAGHEVAIAGPHGAHRGNLAAEIIDVRMGRAIDPRADAVALRQLARAYRGWRPDVIHAHGSKGGVLGRLARTATPRIPLIFTPHNYAFTNYFSSSIERGVYRAIETGLSPLATRTLCVCEAERRIARTVGPDSRTRVVYNGVHPFEPERAIDQSDDLGPSGPVLLAITEFQEPKGVPTLVEAMASILTRHPSATLVVAGEGPTRTQIESQIAAAGIGSSIRLLGQVPSVSGLLARADVLVAPGWSESFPYAILEAMSASLPVVATDVGGVGEAIEDGVTGRLVPPKNAAALAAATSDLIADPQTASGLASAALERQREMFSFDAMVSGTFATYAEVGLR